MCSLLSPCCYLFLRNFNLGMFNSCILGDILLMALKLLLMLNCQLGDFVTFSTPLLQSCLTVQKMKPLVVLFLFLLQAGHQWISVGCGGNSISWTWTLYILQIVQSQFGIERNPRYGSVPIHPPSQFSHSRYSLIMSLYSPYFTIPGIKHKVSWIPYLPNPFLIFTSTPSRAV